MPRASITLLLVLLSSLTLARGWVRFSFLPGGRHHTNLKTRCRAVESSSGSSSEDDKPASLDVGFFAALKQRQLELEKDELRVEGNWRSARSSSYVGVSLGDYVRRLALSWPLVAMGTSEGALVVAKLGSEAPESTQQVVVGIAPEGSHPADIDGEDRDIAMELLHGDYDGRGITAIAFDGTRVASGGRDGVVKVWRLPTDFGDASIKKASKGHLPELILEGVLPCGGVVSAIVLEGRDLWAASTDGKLRHFEAKAVDRKAERQQDPNSSSKSGASSSSSPSYSFQHIGKLTSVNLGSPLLCLAMGDRTLSTQAGGGLLVAGLADGRCVAMAAPDKDDSSGNLVPADQSNSVEESTRVVEWAPHSANVRVRSVCVAHGAVFTGGSDGSITRKWVSNPPKPSNGVEETTTAHSTSAAAAGVMTGGSKEGTESAEEASQGAAQEEPTETTGTAPAEEVEASSSLFPTPAEALMPPHGGQVVALCGRKGGLLVSGAHDGTLRIWDATATGTGMGKKGDVEPRCLYGFGGYKVWLGSVTTDGTRLVADGCDNNVIVHDFSRFDYDP